MNREWKGWAFVGPALAHLLVFALIPIGFAFFLSLHKWDILRDDKPFVGLLNYQRLFDDGEFWNALLNSAIFTAASVPLGLAAALAVALLTYQKLAGMAAFRVLFYLPAISSQVAIAMVWIYVFLPKTGMINTALGLAGITNETDFLNQIGWAMAALVFMSIWTGLGPRMVLFLAGLAAIPQTLYEAAAIDGATGSAQFWKITLPMLAPTTLFALVTSTIGAMQLFTPVYMMTKGGPMGSTDMVGYHVYTEAWVNFRLGSASAQSFVLFAVILAVSLIQLRLMQAQIKGAGYA